MDDFTNSQFAGEVHCTDTPSNRAEAFADTNEQQYTYLKNSLQSGPLRTVGYHPVPPTAKKDKNGIYRKGKP
ncbi:YunG family protein [Ectobacillus ponti]|uniref:YunG family protein n=1 Tax=Ectobacillus ponti TaxID=2961894 RepID=UPI003F660C7B